MVGHHHLKYHNEQSELDKAEDEIRDSVSEWEDSKYTTYLEEKVAFLEKTIEN